MLLFGQINYVLMVHYINKTSKLGKCFLYLPFLKNFKLMVMKSLLLFLIINSFVNLLFGQQCDPIMNTTWHVDHNDKINHAFFNSDGNIIVAGNSSDRDYEKKHYTKSGCRDR